MNDETGEEEGREKGGGGGTGAVEESPFLAGDIAAHRGVCKFSSCTRHMWGTRSPHWQGHWLEQQQGVRGGFLYELGVVSYTIRILMYPACILHVS
jgi:hypothetical protein